MVWTVEYYSALHRARIIVSKNTFAGQKQAEKLGVFETIKKKKFFLSQQ